MTLALLDGDILVFRAAAGASETFDFGDSDGKSRTSNPEQARETALASVDAWQKLAKCRDVMVCFTGVHNFRKAVLPTYKAHRKTPKPPDFAATVAAVRDRYPSLLIEGLEADDVLAVLATTDRFIENSVILTMDKDLRTVPGRHMNPLKDLRPVLVKEPEATYYWLQQTLTGDSTDNYVGIPGIGPKRAQAILGSPSALSIPRLWPKVVSAYHAKGLTEADALQQARVARILWRQDYDKETKEVLLWHPKTPERLALSSVVLPKN